jgi:hypothetical protein
VHFDSTWLLPCTLCQTDREDHKHASKHDSWDHSAAEQKLSLEHQIKKN